MKKRLTAMLAGLVLASGMGAASAAGVPDILGSVDSNSYQAMSAPEMGAVKGEYYYGGAYADAWATAGASGYYANAYTDTYAGATVIYGHAFAVAGSHSSATAY